MTAMTVAVVPGRSLGPFALGASLHEILGLVKDDRQQYPAIDLHYSQAEPLVSPVVVTLPGNGIRMRFDGADQRLRLIEVQDFSKIRLQHKGSDLIKNHDDTAHSAGPVFKRVYSLFGPSYPGEYAPPKDRSPYGAYVLSWPGVAFNFPLLHSAWSEEKDHVSLLGSHVASAATSLALFEGRSWPEARRDLFVKQPSGPRMSALASRPKEGLPPEIEVAEVRGDGRVDFFRLNPASAFPITLNQTTTQDLISELGPPDTTYRREETAPPTEQPVHRRAGSSSRPMSNGRPYGGSPSSFSSTGTDTFETDFDSSNAEEDVHDRAARQKFWCYFSHGLDILVGPPTDRASKTGDEIVQRTPLLASTSTVVLKVIIHGNIPGSYAFNRHRRLRWTINLLDPTSSAPNTSGTHLTSEQNFDADIKPALLSVFSGTRSEGKVVNRTWSGGGSSSDSSFFLPDADEDVEGMEIEGESENSEQWLGNTKLYAFPGLVFEVLENGCVSALTVC
ncbi:hypothetical protein BAUCODRAFT_124012 [Baudoinia panamericana UAMH 10762]|uniref:Uncharacterized protein n=1 Tax=Baudoinia panamericana (strain UAMH 10762) TaxID=717646 RepID=M2MCW3_BAUPA|nr:uncharacterized protein BAUCODRAFT_124012 [Baudoinia panamericana UAMH 10762]EMC94376.1 hypothetical protein BAUCODRAFT_124012 [Baudoinia panamericana UAMH 10762]